MTHINPDNYVKLFNLKESLFECYYELTERKKLTIDRFPNIELIYVDGQWFFDKKGLGSYNFSDKKIHEGIDIVEKRAHEFVNFAIKQNRDFSKSSWKELMGIFSEFDKKWGSYIRVVDIPVYCAYYFEKKVVEEMKTYGLQEKDFDILTHPLYNTYHQRRERDLLKLKLKKMPLEEFKEKWGWSQMALFQFHPVDDEYIDEQLSHFSNSEKSLAELENKHNDAEKKYQKLYKKLPKPLKQKADLLQRLLYIRDYRFEQALRGSFLLQKFLRAIASQLKISYDDLIFMTPLEVKKRKVPSGLQMRKKRYAFIGNSILTGKKVDALYNLFNKPSAQTFVRGKGVSGGIVQGKAKIVKSKDQLSRIKKGDIIVCDITTPDYFHALKKVSAIVANIGGFTSHSAIVAREFGIPCVVGCGNATSVFKDNDRVEVDADKGIVRKIE